ncbi:hypothetical protein HDE68_004933 [Pedobacter cryoconitis]|uniref:MACPF domain-containing protein n=1 Tax=Pedobacter cryoconitis TaxID=188932 RepID=A0A7W9E2N6_9SPHI|nr:MAC/perforin domain-containing protein [Pedobacter cryoconitis]MBB5638995.1 hypothetical protein [Pedobacter cryoconitis]
MKKEILVIVLIALFVSCKKKSDEITNPDKKEKLSSTIELVVKGAKQEDLPLYQSSETYNFLGFGYDITDKFNDELSVRASVVNIPAYAASEPHEINLMKGTESSWTTIQAQNAVDLSENFSNSFKETRGLRLFGNTAEKSFPESVATDKKYVYGYYSNYSVWKRCRFYYDQSVNSFLTADFKRDITLLSAQELIHKYGTHVLSGIEIGSKFDVVYQAEAPERNRGDIIMEGLRYALKETFGLMSGHLDDVNLENLNANSSAKIYYSSIGGDISKLKTETINNKLKLNITNWRSSTTEDKARFIGIDTNGLLPLYTFIDNSTKKAEVKSYLEQYFANKSVKLIN